MTSTLNRPVEDRSGGPQPGMTSFGSSPRRLIDPRSTLSRGSGGATFDREHERGAPTSTGVPTGDDVGGPRGREPRGAAGWSGKRIAPASLVASRDVELAIARFVLGVSSTAPSSGVEHLMGSGRRAPEADARWPQCLCRGGAR